jgi:hypothetical protein
VVRTGHRDKVRIGIRLWRNHVKNNLVEDRDVDGIRTLNRECLFPSFFSDTPSCVMFKGMVSLLKATLNSGHIIMHLVLIGCAVCCCFIRLSKKKQSGKCFFFSVY